MSGTWINPTTNLIAQDSTTPSRIPNNASAVFLYGNGKYGVDQTQLTKWANSGRPWRVIDVNAEGVGDTLDIENGDATVADISRWLTAVHASPERLRGMLPALYSSAANYGAVTAAADATGLPWVPWVADWTGTPHLNDNRSTQYESDGAANIDYSLTTPAMWDQTQTTPTAPITPPAPPVEENKVNPKYNVELLIAGDYIVDFCERPGGVVLLAYSGSIFCMGAAFFGCPIADKDGENWGAQNRKAAELTAFGTAGYTVTGTDGSQYTYGD